MRFSTSNLYKGRSIPKNTDIQTHTRQCLYICLGIHEKYTHTHWGASFFSFFIFNTYVYVFISLHRSVNVVWIFLFCLLIMEHQETIWSHMEKSEFPFNSFVWLAILVLYSLLLLPLHIYSVSIQNSNSAHWVHVIQTHGFFMFVFVCVCVFMLFFLFIWTTKNVSSGTHLGSWVDNDVDDDCGRGHIFICALQGLSLVFVILCLEFFSNCKKKRCEISYISTNIDDTILNGQFILLNWKLYLTAEKTNPIASSLIILYCRKNEILIVEKKHKRAENVFKTFDHNHSRP